MSEHERIDAIEARLSAVEEHPALAIPSLHGPAESVSTPLEALEELLTHTLYSNSRDGKSFTGPRLHEAIQKGYKAINAARGTS